MKIAIDMMFVCFFLICVVLLCSMYAHTYRVSMHVCVCMCVCVCVCVTCVVCVHVHCTHVWSMCKHTLYVQQFI